MTSNVPIRSRFLVRCLEYFALGILGFPLALPFFEDTDIYRQIAQIAFIALSGLLLVGYVRSITKIRSKRSQSTFEKLTIKTEHWFQVLTVFSLLSVSVVLIYTYKNKFVEAWPDYKNQVLPMVPVAAILLFILWIFPKISIRSLSIAAPDNTQSEFEREKEKLTLEDNARKTLAQIIGGLFIIGSLVMTYSTYRLSVEQFENTRQIQERENFEKAASQLNSDNPGTRVEGLNSLEQISKVHPENHWKVIERITSFIRKPATPQPGNPAVNIAAGQRSQAPGTQNDQAPNIEKDIQTALNILGSRAIEQDPPGKILDLSGAYLKGADLSNLNFSKANFNNTNLYDADLNNTRLTGARLDDANLSKARILYSNLSGATLINANLTDSVIRQADMTNADLMSANLTKTRLYGVIFGETKVDRAIFKEAVFNDIETLTFEQAVLAIFDVKTVFPKNLESRRSELLAASKENEKK